MVVIEGGGGPRRSSGAVGIDPGRAFGMDVALSGVDTDARALAWRIRAALREGDASSNAPVRLETLATWAIEWRDDTRHRLTLLRGGIGTGMAAWGPGGLCLPTTVPPLQGAAEGYGWEDYLDFTASLQWGGYATFTNDMIGRVDDLLLLRSIDDSAERASLIRAMMRNAGGIPDGLLSAYSRSPLATASRVVSEIPFGAALGTITFGADVSRALQWGDTGEERFAAALAGANAAATALEVSGVVGAAAISLGIAGEVGATASLVAFATGPVGVAFIAGVGAISVGYAIYENWDTITAGAKAGLEAVKDWGSGIAEHYATLENRIASEVDRLGSQLADGTDQLLADLELTIDETVEDVSVWVAETEDALRGAAADLEADLEELAERGASLASDAYRSATSAAGDVADEATRRAGELADDVGQLVGSTVNEARDRATGVAHGLVERGDATLRSIGDAVTFWS